MLNRLLIAVHWVFYLCLLGFLVVCGIWFIQVSQGIYIDLAPILVPLFFGCAGILILPIIVWIITSRWIWFPWQHKQEDKEEDKQ